MEFEDSDGNGTPPGDSRNRLVDEQVEYNIDWTPLDKLSSMDCLLTVTNGNLNWKSMPSAQNAVKFGECGKETISVKLKVSDETISPLLYKYLKLEFHLYEAGLPDTQVAEALIYFRDMESITAGCLSLDDRSKALKQHNPEAVARLDLIKVSFETSQVTFNISTQQRLLVQGFDKAEGRKKGNVCYGSRYDDLTALINSLRSQDTKRIIQIDLLLVKPVLRGGKQWEETLNNGFELAHRTDRTEDRTEDQMAQWFPENALIGDQSVEAFRYLQTFKRNERTRSVNFLEKFPVLLALTQSDGNQSALSECPEQIVSQYLKLDSAKQSVISRLNDLPAGLAFISGVAGSGKTELIKFIIAACIFGQGAAKPVPALYLAPNNHAVDDMANKFQDYFEKLGLEGAPTIMRLYSLDFEVKSVTRALAPGLGTSYQYFNEEKAHGDIKEVDTEAGKKDLKGRAQQFLAAYQLERMGCDLNQQNKKSRSKRIRSTNVSADTAAVAYYQTHIEKYRGLQDILIISERDGSLSDDQLREVRILVKELLHDMLSDFKGIICTTSVVSSNVTVRRFKAELVFTDEAARQSELGSLISIAHYQPHAWFFLGDTAQLKPYVGEDFKAADNPFIRQMSVSLLERAVSAGAELGWLDITHRLRGNLRPLPSKIHYGHRMQNNGIPGWNWPPSTLAFAAEMKKLLGPSANVSNPSRVVVQFPFARATLAGTSSKNITHVRWVLDQVKKMLQSPQLTEIDSKKMASILILPLYKAQVDLYREKLHKERIQKRISDEHFRRIEVRTLDFAQGEERDVVIVDYVQTHKAGFCVDPNRNCLATTRAKQCEILIINAGMINSPGAENSKVGQILAEATELGIVLKVSSCSNCEDPSHKEEECDRKSESKLCNWCNENGHSYATCPKVQCRNCRKLGHVEPDCPSPKLCQQCGHEATTGHRKTCLGVRSLQSEGS
ncbi:Putative Zinc finger, CCHC-type, P-loop containing nucleoside triphosphate hydrolase [Colletotrichum destructivum]|uniref:Zinc finger, CCHC-type, P-loop containing nucleoside triphosphate hydrolase n=1 Tax=Colletotrichum destructivum TaxID=34406 RepID=A0AAX4IZI2_9PEZI|nr:Putative Zinc finger, CCHC-type, P-loop containing nucleoside triphosphate hydrolase [Colletotrichum destructivum]